MDEQGPVTAVAAVPPDRLRIGTTRLSIPYLSSKPLRTAGTGVRRAVVILHDHHRDAGRALRCVTAAAAAAGKSDETIVVAPQFLAEPDVHMHSPGSDVPYWSGGWKQGDHSMPARARAKPVTVSSFTVIDAIMARLASTRTFPDLRLTVVAGHSAGGQFVHRYAAANTEPITTHYLVANPSSYLYLDDQRPSSARAGNRCGDKEPTCGSHNRYRYGLDALNKHMNVLGPEVIRSRYGRRRVTYLLGLADDDPEHPELDRSCAARAQGGHRLERGNSYLDHLQRHYGADVLCRHTLVHIPRVGHCGDAMFSAPDGLRALFPPLPAPRPAERAVADVAPR